MLRNLPLYLNEEIYLEESKVKLYMHQFIMLISSANPKKTALCRFKGYNVPLENIVGEKRDLSWGINPRNKEQSFAYDLLFDDDVPLFGFFAAGIFLALLNDSRGSR